MIRGIRGAIQAGGNTREGILAAARELMEAIISRNGIRAENVSAVFFTVTEDLDAAFPAEVRVPLAWHFVPFLCGREVPVPGSVPRILRVMVLAETGMRQEEIKHQYLGAAAVLRPDFKE